ncbi:unnamed protein product, partial [Closterium sp. NIES-53]
QRGQLRLAYVTSRANTVDIFTKALQPCDHQRFCTVLGLLALLFLTALLLLLNAAAAAKRVAATAATARAAALCQPELHRPTELRRSARAALPCPSRAALPLLSRAALLLLSAAAAAIATNTTMATPTLLTFDAEGHPIDFENWLEDLEWFLKSVTREDISMFEHTSGSVASPTETTYHKVRSQWTTRDASAALAVRNHFPPDQHSHFRQLKTAKVLYDTVVKCYSSSSSATIGRLALQFLFPELADFTTVADLITHLRSLDTRYCAALDADFLAENKPPMYLTLYFLTTYPPDTLRADRDHFLSLDPTKVTIDSFEKRLLEAESTALAVAASRGTPLPSIFEGAPPPCSCPLLPLLLLSTSLVLRRSVLRLLLVARLEAASLGAFGSASTGAEPEEALHTFTLDFGASSCFFRDSTTVTPLTLPVPVTLADPSRGPGGGRYFLLVVDDYMRYTMENPLQRKAEVCSVLICWIRAVRRQLNARFCQDLPVLQLHSDRGGEFSSGLHEEFCGAEGIRQTFTLPASPKQNGIVERRIGLVMEVARTSIVHAAAPHFLWSFAVRYAAEQLNSGPMSPTRKPLPLCGGQARSVMHRRFGSGFYHPGSRCVLSSQDVTFDESVYFYRLHPHRSSPVPLPPLALPVEVSSDTSRLAEGGDPTPAATVTPHRSARLAVPPGFPPRPSSPPLQPVAVDSSAVGGGTIGGAGSGGAECPLGTGGTGETGAGGPSMSARTTRAGGAGTVGAGGSATGGIGASQQETLSPERLCEWAVQWGSPGGGASRARPTRAGGAGTLGAAGGVGGAATVGAAAGSLGGGAGCAGAADSGYAGPGGASAGVPSTRDTGAAGGTGGAGATGGTGGAGPGGARLLSRSCLRFVTFLLLPGSPLPAPTPHTEVTASLTARCEPETRASTHERREHETRASVPTRVRRPCAPAVPGTHDMTLLL